MKDVGITHVSEPKQLRKGFYHIVITTRKEIENYRCLIGFGSHNLKNKKLNDILSLYRTDLPDMTPKKVRYKEILNLIKKNKKETCKNISNVLKIKERYLNRLLNEMVDRRMISVNRSLRAFVYAPYSGIGNVRSKKCFSLPFQRRVKEILRVLHKKKEMTSKEIASEIDLGYSGTIKIVRKMMKKRLLKFHWKNGILVYQINKQLLSS